MGRKIRETKTKPTTRKRQQRKSRFEPLANLEEFLALSNRDQELWGDIGQIVTGMRDGKSLAAASREFQRDPRSVQRLAARALRKLRNGRWAAKKHDRLLRVLPLLNRQGKFQVALNVSQQASIIGRYWNAVDLYRDTGDSSAVREFRGKHVIDAEGTKVPLLTDLQELDRLGSAGELSFESLYARVA
jgi:hypothetical protein